MAKTTSIHVKHSRGVRTISPVVKGMFLSKKLVIYFQLNCLNVLSNVSEHNIYCYYVLGVIRLSKYKFLLTIVLKVMKIEMMLSQTTHHSDKSCCVSLVKFLQLKTLKTDQIWQATSVHMKFSQELIPYRMSSTQWESFLKGNFCHCKMIYEFNWANWC